MTHGSRSVAFGVVRRQLEEEAGAHSRASRLHRRQAERCRNAIKALDLLEGSEPNQGEAEGDTHGPRTRAQHPA